MKAYDENDLQQLMSNMPQHEVSTSTKQQVLAALRKQEEELKEGEKRKARYKLYSSSIAAALVILLLSYLVFTPSGQSLAKDIWDKLILVEEGTSVSVQIDDYEVILHSAKQRYGKNEKINIWATFSYLGEEEYIEISHGGFNYLFFSLHNKDKTRFIGYGGADIAINSTLVQGVPQLHKYITLGIFDGEEIDEEQLKKYEEDQALYLPPDEYVVSVFLEFDDYRGYEAVSIPFTVLDSEVRVVEEEVEEEVVDFEQFFPHDLPAYIPLGYVEKRYVSPRRDNMEIIEQFLYYEDGFIQSRGIDGKVYYIDETGLFVSSFLGMTKGNMIYKERHRHPYYSGLLLPFPVEEGVTWPARGNVEEGIYEHYYIITNTNQTFSTATKEYTEVVEVQEIFEGDITSTFLYDAQDGILLQKNHRYNPEGEVWLELVEIREIER